LYIYEKYVSFMDGATGEVSFASSTSLSFLVISSKTFTPLAQVELSSHLKNLHVAFVCMLKYSIQSAKTHLNYL
jgi:hypothetical protein